MRLTPLLLLVFATPALATKPGGFAVTDLAQLKAGVMTLNTRQFEPRAEPKRITLACTDCKDIQFVDILLSQSTDGTEGRFRSGKTTIEGMEKLCQAREPNCKMERVDLNGATGWVSRTRLGSSAISTTILFKNGDMLIIRSMADAPQTAFDNGKAVRDKIAAKIIGSR